MDILETLKGELLKEGSKSDKIAKLQDALKSVGVDPGSADGIFGPKTKEAVLNFQKKSGLSVDGVVGPETAKALKQAAMNAVSKKLGGGGDDAGNPKAAVADIVGAVGGLFGKK